jgi:hypothetical protein
MSWDLFVQDIPASINSVADMPAEYSPCPIASRDEILGVVRLVAPFADTSDPSWIRIDTPEVNVEINIGHEVPLMGFAFHVRGGDKSAGFIADILDRLNLRAFDPGSDSGIFDIVTARRSLERWRAYRDGVISMQTPNYRWSGP